MPATIHHLYPSATVPPFGLDPLNDAALEIGRGRCHLRDAGIQTQDAAEAWRAWRLLQSAITELEQAAALVLHRHEQLEGR